VSATPKRSASTGTWGLAAAQATLRVDARQQHQPAAVWVQSRALAVVEGDL
jgi:hypothetical protein